MPFNQTGPGATANVGTYNDVAGNQINTTDNSKKVGDINSKISSGIVTAGGAGTVGSGTGTATGVAGSGNVSF